MKRSIVDENGTRTRATLNERNWGEILDRITDSLSFYFVCIYLVSGYKLKRKTRIGCFIVYNGVVVSASAKYIGGLVSFYLAFNHVAPVCLRIIFNISGYSRSVVGVCIKLLAR